MTCTLLKYNVLIKQYLKSTILKTYFQCQVYMHRNAMQHLLKQRKYANHTFHQFGNLRFFLALWTNNWSSFTNFSRFKNSTSYLRKLQMRKKCINNFLLLTSALGCEITFVGDLVRKRLCYKIYQQIKIALKIVIFLVYQQHDSYFSTITFPSSSKYL